MSTRKLVLIIGVGLMALAAFWIFILAGTSETDASPYERWKHTARLMGRVFWWERLLPSSFGRLLRLPEREQEYIDEHEKLRATLLASGYLTNFAVEATIASTNYAQRAQLAARLRKVFEGRTEWEFGVGSNAVFFTCRPEDMALCRKALQQR